MSPNLLIMSTIVTLGILLSVIAYARWKKTGRTQKNNFQNFVGMGSVFIIVGLASDNSTFRLLGLIWLMIGLAERKRNKR